MTMEWYGGELVAKVNSETIKALAVAAEMVLAKAVEVTPALTGALRGSGTQKPTNGGKTREISFGGAATEYALIVHEMPYSNNFSTPGTGPKYLETPLRENADKVLKYLNDATARGLKGG
jgi:hypothetical protein